MGRLSEELKAKFVESNRHEPGMYCDGGDRGARQWGGEAAVAGCGAGGVSDDKKRPGLAPGPSQRG